mgnify:CR=1 FL=1
MVTLHRRENHINIDQWFNSINKLAKIHTDLEFIIPLHPNPNVQKFKHLLNNVNIIEPLTHIELIKLLVIINYLPMLQRYFFVQLDAHQNQYYILLIFE